MARDCGVTRLSDITGLDRLGIPVWQAVRPWSRSVSVHQGKNFDRELAKLGACMEAIECHLAEAWVGETRTAAFADLPQDERLTCPDDCARVRGQVGDDPVAWTAVERIGSPRPLWVPAGSVSLDSCERHPAWIERSSCGQGAGFDLAYASGKGLMEVIENDAYEAWRARPFVARGRDAVAISSIRFEWFGELVERLRDLDIVLCLFAPPAVVVAPVIVAELIDQGHEARGRHITWGVSGHLDAVTALKGAITEAAQSRLTQIAGSRDDLPLHMPELAPLGVGHALPLPRGAPVRDFDEIHSQTRDLTPEAALAEVVEALADAGYSTVGRVVLSPADSPLSAVKMFVPGLAVSSRARRAP